MSNTILQIIESNGNPNRRNSNALDIDFDIVRVSTALYIAGLPVVVTAGHFDFGGKQLNNVTQGASANSVATKSYVDSAVGGSSLTAAEGVKIESQVIKLDLADTSLEIVTDQVKVKRKTGGLIDLDADGLFVSLGNSVTGTGGSLDVKPADDSLAIVLTGLKLQLTGNSGLETVVGGVQVKVGNGVERVSGSLNAKSGDSTITVDSAGIKQKFTELINNNEAAPITLGQVVYLVSFGNVELFKAQDSNVGNGTLLGVVAQASINPAEQGLIAIRRGYRVTGASGLIVGAPVYASPGSDGTITQDGDSGFKAGDPRHGLGYADTATSWIFDPWFDGYVGSPFRDYKFVSTNGQSVFDLTTIDADITFGPSTLMDVIKDGRILDEGPTEDWSRQTGPKTITLAEPCVGTRKIRVRIYR